jgi:hypothetical protein
VPSYRAMNAIALALMLVVLWAVTHRYQGLARDGELYAFQAFARIHPALGADLYLQNASQDQYSIFSRIYAPLIRSVGLQNAELLLFIPCTAWFLAAVWFLARALGTRGDAWLTSAVFIVTVGYYGSYKIFHFAEDYLTARSLAEALVVTSFACHFRGKSPLAFLLAILALFIHPLMALPGSLLLICLCLSTRHAVYASAAAITATLGIAVAAVLVPPFTHLFAVLDPAWLEVVRERSQFLFLKYWTLQDWELNARPFVGLTLTALAVEDERQVKLCLAAMLVGASGLAIALIAGAVGPLAVLLQGQAWRWVWVTGFASVLLLVPTVSRIWRDEKCGPLCAVLLLAGWTCSAVDGLACTEAALGLWLVRTHIGIRASWYLRWAAAAAGALLVAWALTKSWPFSPASPERTGNTLLARTREFFGLSVPALLIFWLCWRWISNTRSMAVAALAGALFFICSLLVLPESFRQSSTAATAVNSEEFADWRNAIPAASNVLILPTRKSASFAWFTLQRPSYLSVDQSAGVVFSRATALEVRRRSEVLRPLMDPDWEILTHIAEKARGKGREISVRPLTTQILAGICADPQLGFVIAQEKLGLDSIRHSQAGMWKDWSLYDCRRVQSPAPAA